MRRGGRTPPAVPAGNGFGLNSVKYGAVRERSLLVAVDSPEDVGGGRPGGLEIASGQTPAGESPTDADAEVVCDIKASAVGFHGQASVAPRSLNSSKDKTMSEDRIE